MASRTSRIDPRQLRRGTAVYSGEGQQRGAIERTDADSVTVDGQQYEFSSVERVEGDCVYLTRQVGASALGGWLGTRRELEAEHPAIAAATTTTRRAA